MNSCGNSKCGVMVNREMFALDDGDTWVITGDMKHVDGFRGKVMVKRDVVGLETCGLFYLNAWETMTRLMPAEEVSKRKELAGLKDRRFMVDDDNCEQQFYVKVVGYLAY